MHLLLLPLQVHASTLVMKLQLFIQVSKCSTGNTRALVPCCIHRPTLLLVLHTPDVPELRHNVLGSFSVWATLPCLVPLSIVPSPSPCAWPRLSIPHVHRTLLSAPHSSGSFTHLLSFCHSLQEVNNALEDSCNHVVQGLPRYVHTNLVPQWTANGHAQITSSLQSISRLFTKKWLDTYLSVVLLNLNSRVPFTMLKIVFVKVSPLILSNE